MPIDLRRGEVPARTVALELDLDLEAIASTSFNYTDPAGLPALRQAYLDSIRSTGIPIEQTLVCHGALQGIELALRAAASRGCTRLLMPSPGYREATTIARRLGFHIAPLPMHDGLVDHERLSALASSATVLYLNPSCNNPDGTAVDPADRLAIAELIARHGATLIEDDPYRRLVAANSTEHGESIVSLALSLDPSAHAIHFESFSKTLMPGLRCCVAWGSREFRDAILLEKHDFGTSPFASEVARLALQSGFLDHAVSRIRRRLAQGHEALLRALAPMLDDPAIALSSAGYFAWLTVDRFTTDSLAVQLERSGVLAAAGAPFLVNPGGTRAVRLSLAWEDADRIGTAAERIVAALRSPATELVGADR